MQKKTIEIKLESGLEASPIALLVQEASRFESKIYLETESKKVNAKSIMGMMSLGLDNGEELTVVAEGEDEKAAVAGIEAFLAGTK
ncbi:MAG: HPr family phosphocarrier protein [Lachnospiraceae bacterium]|jgi:catabolite repression HPr-like protein|nr:HPr family phosphocarrier protein [Lachnospiraceae bacterium]MCR5425517.1 HPr family phosphocarrier protein [Lachnospiraceae bacterium]